MPDVAVKVKTADRRAFLATGSADDITVHTLSSPGGALPAQSGVRLRRYTLAELAGARTLADLSGVFGAEQILYDPTRLVARLRGIVRLASEFRHVARRDIDKIAYEPRSRTIFVTLSRLHDAEEEHGIASVMLTLAKAAQRWQKSGIDCHLSVRVCAKVPPAALLVLVDRASIGSSLRASFLANWRKVLAVFGLSTAFATPAAAQAVSEVSTTTYAGISVNSVAKGDFSAELAAPVTNLIGAQLDAGVGTDGYLGAGGQLFLRDPNIGLVGLTSSLESLDGNVMYRMGAKAEYYLSTLTIGGNAGWQGLDKSNGAYGGIDLSFYATPDFELRAAAELSPDLSLLTVGAEWRPGFEALPGLSIYSDFEHSSDGENAAKVGLIYHFGEDGVSLMDRDRRHKTRSTIFNRAALKYVS